MGVICRARWGGGVWNAFVLDLLLYIGDHWNEPGRGKKVNEVLGRKMKTISSKQKHFEGGGFIPGETLPEGRFIE